MKKLILILFVITLFLVIYKGKDSLLIPDEAIRLRVIANSDLDIDQSLKMNIKTEVEKELYKVIKDTKTINEARNIIKNNLEEVNNILKKYNVEYDINYGFNYFPDKEYKGVKYSEGNYESLVITIGKGLGENWWCVLFPPLCFLEDNNLEENEYKFYVNKLINKFIKN